MEIHSATNLPDLESHLQDVTVICNEKQLSAIKYKRFLKFSEKRINFYELFHDNL